MLFCLESTISRQNQIEPAPLSKFQKMLMLVSFNRDDFSMNGLYTLRILPSKEVRFPNFAKT